MQLVASAVPVRDTPALTLDLLFFGDSRDLIYPLVDKAEYDDSVFESWKWTLPDAAVPLALTVFGDWIYSHADGIYLFSPSAANNCEIATVVEEIDWAIENISERAPWLYPQLLTELGNSGFERVRGKLLHFVTPLCLGGVLETSNVQQVNIREHTVGMQKLLRQL